jgi:hypothetical protein
LEHVSQSDGSPRGDQPPKPDKQRSDDVISEHENEQSGQLQNNPSFLNQKSVEYIGDDIMNLTLSYIQEKRSQSKTVVEN